MCAPAGHPRLERGVEGSVPRAAFSRCRDERGNVEEVADPLKPGNNGPAIGVTQDQRRGPAGIDDGLDGVRVGGERAAVQVRRMDPQAPGAQRLSERGEVPGLVPQAVDQDYLGTPRHRPYTALSRAK